MRFYIQRRLTVVTAVLAVAVAMAQGGELTGSGSITLPVATTAGMQYRAGAWVAREVLYEAAPEGFGIKVTQASSLVDQLQPSAARIREGSEEYLTSPTVLDFELLAAKSGNYTMYLRLRKNSRTYRGPGSALNKGKNEKRSPEIAAVLLDGKPVSATPFDRLTEVWRWCPIGRLRLEPGHHLLRLNPLPGYDVERLAFAPSVESSGGTSGAAPGLDISLGENKAAGKAGEAGLNKLDDEFKTEALSALPAARRRVVESASIVTALIQPLGVAEWQRLDLDGDFAGVAPIVSVSTNGGLEWLTVPADRSLAMLRPAGDGGDSLCVRLELRPAAGNPAPRFSAMRASYRPAELPVLSMAGGGLALRLDRKTGCLYDVHDAQTGVWLGLPLRRDLFAIAWRPSQDAPDQALQSSAFKLEKIEDQKDGDAPSWKLSFVHEVTGLQAVCRIKPAAKPESCWLWTLEVHNGGTGIVRNVEFPRLPGLLCGGRSLLFDSLWAWPSKQGSGIFPGDMGMGCLFVSGSSNGLYLASQDQSLGTVKFTGKTSEGQTVVSALSLSVVPPGQTRIYDYALAVGSADWHWAADRYHDWAYSWMKRPQWPAWASRADGWFGLLADSEAALLDRKSTTLFEEAQWFGLPYIQQWVGCGDGEFVGRMPYLSPRLGTPEMSRKDSERLRRMGGHIGVYIQSQEWDASFATSNRLGFILRKYFPPEFQVESEEWSDKFTVNGVKGTHGPGVRNMCVATAEWQDHIARHAGERVSLFGHDAAYIDQMGCIYQSCSDGTHTHAPEYQAAGRGLTEMAEKSLAAMRRTNPDVTLANEGMNAATGQYVHFHLASGMPAEEYGKEFLYTFPDLAVVRGSGNGVFASQKRDIAGFARDLFLFHRFEMPQYDLYFRDIVLLRQRVHDWQYDGRFMDDVGLVSSAPWDPTGAEPSRNAVRAKWFLYTHGNTAGVLINFRNEEALTNATVSLRRDVVPFVPSGNAFLYSDDGTVEAAHYQVGGSALVFTIPPRKVGSILVPGPVSAQEALRTFAFQTYEAGPDRLILGAVNLSGQPLQATWTLTAFPGLQVVPAGGTVDLPPFGCRRIEVALPNLLACQAMGEVAVAWTCGGQPGVCKAVVAPPLRNGSMDLDENQDGSPDSWWNFDSGFCHRIHRYAPDVDMGKLPAVCDEAVKRSGRASVRLPGAVTIDYDSGEVKGKHELWRSSVSQHLWLKRATRYRVSAYAYWKDPAAKCEFMGVKPEHAQPGEWTRLSRELETGLELTQTIITLANQSPEGVPVWFDDVTIEEIGK